MQTRRAAPGGRRPHGLPVDGAEQLRRAHPSLITVRISPFGDTGPWTDRSAGDLVHLALGGVMMNCGYDPDPSGEYDTPPIAPQMWQSYRIEGGDGGHRDPV